jgi:hypothetical protein
MAATDEDCLVGDDMDTFTVMNEDIVMVLHTGGGGVVHTSSIRN